MSVKLKTPSHLIEWCDKQVVEEKKLAICWDGGGDSGWAYLTIDDEEVRDHPDEDVIRQLLDLMYDCLDYGSWAGEFSARGEATYDSQIKAFVGTDYYGEDSTYEQECAIKVKIPKSLWFDTIEIQIEDEQPIVDAAFVLRNGFLTQEHDDAIKLIVEDLNEAVDKEVEKYRADPESEEYRNVWQNEQIARTLFKEEGDHLVYTLKHISIGTTATDEKEICLKLQPEENEY